MMKKKKIAWGEWRNFSQVECNHQSRSRDSNTRPHCADADFIIAAQTHHIKVKTACWCEALWAMESFKRVENTVNLDTRPNGG